MNKPIIIAKWQTDKRPPCLVLLSLVLSERRRKRTTTTRTLLAFKFRLFPVPAFAKNRRGSCRELKSSSSQTKPLPFYCYVTSNLCDNKMISWMPPTSIGSWIVGSRWQLFICDPKIDPLLLDHVWIWGGRWHATCCWSYLVFSPPLQMMKK